MKNIIFAKYQQFEDEIKFFVNGELVGSANHDEHGWAGMESVSDLFDKIAAELGIEVEELEEDPE